MKIHVISSIVCASWCFSITSLSDINNAINKSKNNEEKWLPETYVRNIDLIYSSALKGIKGVLYLCGKDGLTKKKAIAVYSFIKLVLDVFKPLNHSLLKSFHDFIFAEIGNEDANENDKIISADQYKHILPSLDILGVNCVGEECLKYYNDEPYTLWYLFHSLSVAKAYQASKGELGEFTPYETMEVLIQMTNQCIFDDDTENNPFSDCEFGRCNWIKPTYYYENAGEIHDSGMGLVLWLWRLHNAMCVNESLAQTALATYKGLKASHSLCPVNFLGKDVRFPPIYACRECRTTAKADKTIISANNLSKYINGEMRIIDMDYIKDFVLHKTYEFLIVYYKEERWYDKNYRIQWIKADNAFKYVEYAAHKLDEVKALL